MSTEIKEILPIDISMVYYNFIKDNVTWNSGVLSNFGISRLQCDLSLCIQEVKDVVNNIVISTLCNYQNVHTILGIYLNYYRNGKNIIIQNIDMKELNKL